MHRSCTENLFTRLGLAPFGKLYSATELGPSSWTDNLWMGQVLQRSTKPPDVEDNEVGAENDDELGADEFVETNGKDAQPGSGAHGVSSVDRASEGVDGIAEENDHEILANPSAESSIRLSGVHWIPLGDSSLPQDEDTGGRERDGAGGTRFDGDGAHASRSFESHSAESGDAAPKLAGPVELEAVPTTPGEPFSQAAHDSVDDDPRPPEAAPPSPSAASETAGTPAGSSGIVVPGPALPSDSHEISSSGFVSIQMHPLRDSGGGEAGGAVADAQSSRAAPRPDLADPGASGSKNPVH